MSFKVMDRKESDPKDSAKSLLPFLSKSLGMKIYPDSINESDGCTLFLGRVSEGKFLFIVSEDGNAGVSEKFEGEVLQASVTPGGATVKKCAMTHRNAAALQGIFPFTRATAVGLTDSFGFGDRLGLANSGHLRALKGHKFRPILAQQSIRELTRTNRTPDDVMDASVWAVFQEGYRDGFGADADHLKRTEDIDNLIRAGFRTFTFDPSDFVVNGVEEMSIQDVRKKIEGLPWKELDDSPQALTARYAGNVFAIDETLSIKASREETERAALKYGGAIAHIKRLYEHLRKNYSNINYEVEVSIDETDTVTSPFEHFFIVTELKRLGVEFISLAPRFIGDFEKGIDYKGDLDLFRREYERHARISARFGNYKISLHSGSDKFSAYKVIGKLGIGFTHVKTAGTSYLEALKVIALKDPGLFRKILDFAVGLYDTERKSYHVSADLRRIKPAREYKDSDLGKLFDSNDVRQVLHVTYGRVLTEKGPDGKFLFRDGIYECLDRNEELHYDILITHFKKHLDPFKK